MRKTMKIISWLVFLGFIALSSYANYLHGDSLVAGGMLAVVPVGFAASVFILEGLISAGRSSRWTFAAIGFVALASGVASYLGLYGMAIDAGIGRAQAVLMPLAFDGVVLVASMGIRGFSLTHVPPRVPRVKPARVPAPVPVAVDTVPAVSLPDVPASSGHVPTVTSPRGPGRDTWDKALARKLLAEGVLSHRDIAERVGCSRKSVDRLAQTLAPGEVDG